MNGATTMTYHKVRNKRFGTVQCNHRRFYEFSHIVEITEWPCHFLSIKVLSPRICKSPRYSASCVASFWPRIYSVRGWNLNTLFKRWLKTRKIVAETCNFAYVWINFLLYSNQIFKTIEYILVNLLSLEWCNFFFNLPVWYSSFLWQGRNICTLSLCLL